MSLLLLDPKDQFEGPVKYVDVTKIRLADTQIKCKNYIFSYVFRKMCYVHSMTYRIYIRILFSCRRHTLTQIILTPLCAMLIILKK